jgi:nucleoredoxin
MEVERMPPFWSGQTQGRVLPSANRGEGVFGPSFALYRSVRIALVTITLVTAVRCAFGGVMPLTAKEIGLMLRSGYSNEAILRELSVRRFGDEFNSEAEKQLIRAGAGSPLIDALRRGAYSLTASEIAATKAKLAAKEGSPAKALEHPNEGRQQNQSDPASAPSAAAEASDVMYQHLKDDLVYLHQGAVTHFDDQALEHKKLYLLFFSANWSAAGRKFTAQLVDYYNRVVAQHPEFEVIFFSADRSQFGMETYMGQSNMPFPAVAWDKRTGKAGAMQNNLVHEIPCLVLTDATGRILSYSHGGENVISPEKVLADLDGIFTGSGASTAPQTP